jgi:hypothetical protein
VSGDTLAEDLIGLTDDFQGLVGRQLIGIDAGALTD